MKWISHRFPKSEITGSIPVEGTMQKESCPNGHDLMQIKGNRKYCNTLQCKYGHDCKENNQIRLDGWGGFIDYLAYGDMVLWCGLCGKKKFIVYDR